MSSCGQASSKKWSLAITVLVSFVVFLQWSEWMVALRGAVKQAFPQSSTKSSIKHLAHLAKHVHDDMIFSLKQDYGEHFIQIFQKNGTLRQMFAPAGANSSIRLKQKLKMKILHVYISVQAMQEPKEKFIWATGGHSAAAGHGNLFNESYTAVMEQNIQNMFKSIGIAFEGRNYAMGGTPSGPEIALCSEAIFGTDIDVLTWDFGMTDGKWVAAEAMYEQRAGLNPSHPVLVAMNVKNRQLPLFQRADERGQSSYYMNPGEMVDMLNSVPDTFGKTEGQIHDMPRLVRYLKCQGAIEKGEPGCTKDKYSNIEGECKRRKGMAKWHPGWKMHAIYGNFLALFLADTLLEAMDELVSLNSSKPREILLQLQREENVDIELLKKTSEISIENSGIPVNNDLLNDANASIFFCSPSICHTARLPSQTRYEGILTETNETAVHGYYKGIHTSEAKNLTSQEDIPMPLVWDEERGLKTCPLELQHDFKDFFFVSEKMNTATLTVPNAAEVEAYGRKSQKLLGVLIVCLKGCDWGMCPKHDIRENGVQNGTVKLEVNGQLVTSISQLGHDCFVLGDRNGNCFQPNDSGQFVLQAKVIVDDFMFRISSFIVI